MQLKKENFGSTTTTQQIGIVEPNKRPAIGQPPSQRGIHRKTGSGSSTLLAKSVCAAAAIFLSALFLWPSGNRESESPAWKHAQAAQSQGKTLAWVSASGSAQYLDAILVDENDLDQQTSVAIKNALLAGDLASVEQHFIRANPQPQATQIGATNQDDAPQQSLEVKPIAPILTEGLRSEILSGDANFYHIHLCDSCWNDGDVVEILVNGKSLFIVPITNAGSTLTVPLSSSQASVIAIRGVRDGAGGITVACKTSRGEGFVRVMQPGEIRILGVAK